MNADNARLLNDEQSIAQAEGTLATQEQEARRRAQAASSVDEKSGPRVQQLLSRLGVLEAEGFQTPDFAKARAVLKAIASEEPPLAQSERGQALPVRKAALQARDVALRALVQAVTQLEALKNAQRRDLEAIDSFVAAAEKAATQRREREAQRQAADKAASEKLAADRAAQERAAAAKAAADRAAAERAAADRAAQLQRALGASTPPAPRPAPASIHPASVVPAPTLQIPTPPAPRAPAAPAKTAPIPTGPLSVPPRLQASVPPAARSAPPGSSAHPASTTGKHRKVTRRRRVRLAPPPKKLDVDVAIWGDNTFYTGFDNRITSGGLFVTSLETLPRGHELDVSIALEGKRIQTRGRVEMTRVDNTANPECTSGAAIKLLTLQSDAATAIEAFFRKRPPLFIVAGA